MKKSFSLLLTLAVILITQVSLQAATLEGFWKLEEGATGTPAADGSGNGIIGVYDASVDPTILGPAGFGSAGNFNGSSSLINFGDIGSTPLPNIAALTNNFSVEAWIKPDATPAGVTQRIIGSNPGWGFGIRGTEMKFTTFGKKDYITAGGSINAKMWTHVAMVMDANNDVTFYVNGNNRGTVTHTAPGNVPGGDFTIGKTGLEFFDGGLDEVAVYSGTLTQNEIRSHMTAGIAGRSFSLPYSNSFDTDTASFFTQNPEFTDFGTPVSVVGGVVEVTPSGSSDSYVTIPGLRPNANETLVIDLDLGSTLSASQNVGLRIGENTILFHPGHNPGGSAQGAFRVDGPGGFGNQAMNFLPAVGDLHNMHVEMTGSGVFNISVTDANSATVYQNTFTNPNSVGGAIGFHRGINGTAASVGRYDNLSLVIQENASKTTFHYKTSSATTLPTLVDQGGEGNDATAQATAALSTDIPTVGVPAGGLGDRSFNPAAGGAATDDTLSLKNSLIADHGGMTVETWFKYDGGGAALNKIIDYAGTENLSINSATNEVLFRINSNGALDSVIGTVTQGQWHYAAVVFDTDGNTTVNGEITGTATLYFDGVEVGTSGPLTISTFGDTLNLPAGRPIGIGQHPFGGENLQGLIYSPRVSLGALSQSELLFVPEPSSVLLLGIGGVLAMMVFVRRRKVNLQEQKI